MNQVTNKVPYGLLSEEEQEQFSGEGNYKGLYKMYSEGFWEIYTSSEFEVDMTYRLIIKDDEWYWVDDLDGNCEAVEGRKLINSEDVVEYSEYATLRPATPAEIEAAKPKELTLEEKVKAEYKDRTNQEVIMLTYNDSNGYLSIKDCPDCEPHVILQSMKGFYKYVYLCNNGEFSLGHTPTSQFAMYETVAVLFTKDSK